MDRARGFTLIEIIVATSLFALLMTAYYVAFTNVLLLEEHVRDQRAYGTIGPAVLDLIEDDLQSLYTHPQKQDAFPFRGENDSRASEPADRLNFVARRASIHQEEFFGADNWVRSPINEVGYRLAAAGSRFGGVRRLFRREGFYVDETPLSGGDYFEIYDRVVGFDVQYVGYRVEEEARADQDSLEERRLDKFESWDSEERKGFPTAVIVTLTLEPPRMVADRPGDDQEEPDRRTFVRILPLVQADDIPPPAAAPGQPGQPGNTPRGG